MSRSRVLLATALLVLPAATAACGGPPSPMSSLSPAAIKKEIAPADDDKAREIPLQGVSNARGFGGLKGDKGPITSNRFFRSATLSSATETDKNTLVQHGIKMDIDLRTVWEVVRSPDALSRDRRFRYLHISLMGWGFSDWNYLEARGDLYVRALSHHQPELRRIFKEMVDEKDGAILFHCSSGKDRTGIVAAILLQLAGVSDEDIIHNYVISAHYLFPNAPDDRLPTVIMLSPPGAMGEFLRVLEKHYGGSRKYLLHIGLSEADVKTLETRLGQQ